jgi:hypothetical protein
LIIATFTASLTTRQEIIAHPPILVAPNLSWLPVRCGFLLNEYRFLATAIIRQTGE